MPNLIPLAQNEAAYRGFSEATIRNIPGTAGGGLLTKTNLLSFGSAVGISLIEYLLRPGTEQVVNVGEVRLSIDPQWPSRRVFGRREVGGQVFFAGSRVYKDGNWRPNSGLPGGSVYVDRDAKDPSVGLLDVAAWVSEGALTELEGIRIRDEYIALKKTTISGVDYYTPVTVTGTAVPKYFGAFYVRKYFGVDQTDRELSSRYSRSRASNPDTEQSTVWDARRKDANHSWVCVTFVDTHRDVWNNFGDFTDISFLVKGQKVSDMTAPTDKTKSVYTDNVAAVQHWIECNLVEGQDYASVSHRHFQDAYNWAAITHDNEYELFSDLPDGVKRQATQGKRLTFYRDMPPKSKNGTLNIAIEEGFDLGEFRNICDTIRQGFTYESVSKLCVTTGQNLDMTGAVAIDPKDIISIRTEAQPRRQGSFNTLRARMVQSQAHGYQPIELEIGDDHSIERDGGKIPQNLGDLDGMTDYMEVARKMNSLVYRQRFNQIWRVTLLPHYKYLKALPDDPIFLNSRIAQVENHPTRIIAKEIDEDTGQVTLVLRYAPHNEFIDKQSLPPIEQPPGRAPLPHAITDLVFHGSPGTKFGFAHVSLEWDSPRYYKTTIVSWRPENGTWNAGIPVENDRTDTQRYSLDGVDFDVGSVYEFEVVNENGYGEKSIPYREKWTARSDTTAPPAPSGVVATGLVQGVHISRTEIDPAAVPDYSKTTASITYTPTGGTEKTENKEFLGTDAEWRFSDIGKNEKISLSIVVKDVDTAGNESTGVTVATTTESAVEIAGSFDNFPIGGRFGWNNYQQRTPAESPADPWDALSWYINDRMPPRPAVAGPPLTKALFEALGTSAGGSDLIVLNPGTIGGLNFTDFCDANSERAANFTFAKFTDTRVRAWISDDYWAIYRLRYMSFATHDRTIDGTISTIWFRPILVHSHFVTPPTFGSGTGQPTLYLDFQLSRGAKGEPGDRGLPGQRGLPGGRGERGLPGVDGDEWRFVIQDTATAGTPSITNKTDRTVDPGTPTGWKKFNSGDADLQIDNVLKPFRWEAASQKVNGRWSDWKIILLSVGGERVQAWFTFVARHKFVQWRRWKEYQITNNVESVTDYTDADVPIRVTGTEARAKALDALRWVDGTGPQSKTPPVPGKQFGNSSSITVPQKVIRGAREATTPSDTITTLSPLFNMDMRYRNNESEGWHLAPANDWNFGVIDAALAEAAGQRHFEEWCTHRYYDSETLGRYQDFVTPEFCRELDHEAFVPVGGLRGQALFHDATSTLWKFIELADIAGFTGTGGLWTQIRAEVTQLLADVATLKAAPAPVDPITIGFNMITYKSFRATVSGGGSGNYSIRYKRQTDNVWITLASQVANYFDVPQSPRTLEAGTTYDIQGSVGTLPFSATHTVTTENQTAPAPPTHLSGTRSGASLTVTWNEGTAGKGVTWDTVTNYRVIVTTQSGDQTIKNISGATTASFTIRSLVDQHFPYHVSVEAFNSIGRSRRTQRSIPVPSSGGGGEQ